MLAIIMKDYYETFRIRKNLFGMLFGFGSMAVMIALSHTFYIFALFTLVVLPLIGISPIQYSLEQDDVSKFDDVLLTWPLTKKEYICSKFISGLTFTGITWILSLLVTCLYVFGYRTVSAKTGFLLWVAGLAVALIFLAVCSIGFFTLGSKKGAVFYIVITLITGFVYILTWFNVDFSAIFAMNRVLLLLICFVFSLLLLFISYVVSVKIYTRKHS